MRGLLVIALLLTGAGNSYGQDENDAVVTPHSYKKWMKNPFLQTALVDKGGEAFYFLYEDYINPSQKEGYEVVTIVYRPIGISQGLNIKNQKREPWLLIQSIVSSGEGMTSFDVFEAIGGRWAHVRDLTTQVYQDMVDYLKVKYGFQFLQ